MLHQMAPIVQNFRTYGSSFAQKNSRLTKIALMKNLYHPSPAQNQPNRRPTFTNGAPPTSATRTSTRTLNSAPQVPRIQASPSQLAMSKPSSSKQKGLMPQEEPTVTASPHLTPDVINKMQEMAKFMDSPAYKVITSIQGLTSVSPAVPATTGNSRKMSAKKKEALSSATLLELADASEKALSATEEEETSPQPSKKKLKRGKSG